MVITIVAIPAAICWVAFFGKLYGAIGFAAFLLFMIFMMWLRRRRNVTEEEMLRRIDKAMGKPSDDPRQMARWMR